MKTTQTQRRRPRIAAALGAMLATAGCASGVTTSGPQAGLPRSLDGGTGQLLRYCEKLREGGGLVTAAGMCERAHQLDPSDPAPLLLLAQILLDMGQRDSAIKVYHTILSRTPSQAEARYSLGKLYVAGEQYELAAQQFEAALRASPGETRLYNALGVARSLLGRHIAAQETFLAGLKIAPENVALRNNLGLSLALSGRHEEAIAMLSSLAADPAADATSHKNLQLARSLAAGEQPAEAMALLEPQDPVPLAASKAAPRRELEALRTPHSAPRDSVARAPLDPAPGATNTLVVDQAAIDRATPPSVAAPLVLTDALTQPIEEPEMADAPTDEAISEPDQAEPEFAGGEGASDPSEEAETADLADEGAELEPGEDAESTDYTETTDEAEDGAALEGEAEATLADEQGAEAAAPLEGEIAAIPEQDATSAADAIASATPGPDGPAAPAAGAEPLRLQTAQAQHAASDVATATIGRYIPADVDTDTPPGGPLAIAPALEPAEYAVQFAAYQDSDRAERGWSELQTAAPDLLEDVDTVVREADLGPEKGFVYRLRSTPLTKSEADELCGALQARGIACLSIKEGPAAARASESKTVAQ